LWTAALKLTPNVFGNCCLLTLFPSTLQTLDTVLCELQLGSARQKKKAAEEISLKCPEKGPHPMRKDPTGGTPAITW
jgi:hypothetical protein